MSTNKTNFNSAETSQRLFAAFIASLPPGTKFDYKIIAKYMDTTESAIEHRFRPLKAQGEFFQRALADANSGGKPMKQHLEEVLKIKNKEHIQKYFGASTEQGLAFQARTWKNNAKVLTDAVENGEDPVAAFNKHLHGGGGGGGSGSATPKRARAAPAAPAVKTPGTAKRRKTAQPVVIKDEPSPSDNVDSSEMNYSEMDLTDDSPRVIKKEDATPKRTPIAKGTGMSKYKAKEIAGYRAQDAAAAAASSPTKTGFGVSPATTPSTADVPGNYWDLDTGAGEDDGSVETPSKSAKRGRSKSKDIGTAPGNGNAGGWFDEDEYDV
ncbi:hypothetical protein QBC44DRAFT_370840 [Cladorrhinum sp. PSN332]|nr:hypothetical protein QBC44DRAFT_370840 [Cladorrhinum sp. PSN332]